MQASILDGRLWHECVRKGFVYGFAGDLGFDLWSIKANNGTKLAGDFQEMDDAAQTVIRWYYAQKGGSKEQIDELVSALIEGCEKGEQDSTLFRDESLFAALKLAEGTPHEAFIDQAVRLHLEIEELKGAKKTLETLEQIAKLSANPVNSPIAGRIVSGKLRELIATL